MGTFHSGKWRAHVLADKGVRLFWITSNAFPDLPLSCSTSPSPLKSCQEWTLSTAPCPVGFTSWNPGKDKPSEGERYQASTPGTLPCRTIRSWRCVSSRPALPTSPSLVHACEPGGGKQSLNDWSPKLHHLQSFLIHCPHLCKWSLYYIFLKLS